MTSAPWMVGQYTSPSNLHETAGYGHCSQGCTIDTSRWTPRRSHPTVHPCLQRSCQGLKDATWKPRGTFQLLLILSRCHLAISEVTPFSWLFRALGWILGWTMMNRKVHIWGWFPKNHQTQHLMTPGSLQVGLSQLSRITFNCEVRQDEYVFRSDTGSLLLTARDIPSNLLNFLDHLWQEEANQEMGFVSINNWNSGVIQRPERNSGPLSSSAGGELVDVFRESNMVMRKPLSDPNIQNGDAQNEPLRLLYVGYFFLPGQNTRRESSCIIQ